MDVIVDFIEQSIVNKKSPLHCVTYEMNNHIVNVSRKIVWLWVSSKYSIFKKNALKKLAEMNNGRFHCYSNSQEVNFLIENFLMN